MTTDQLESVRAAIDEFYTLDDVYYFVTEGIWTKEMFKTFFNETQCKSRRKYYNHF